MSIEDYTLTYNEAVMHFTKCRERLVNTLSLKREKLSIALNEYRGENWLENLQEVDRHIAETLEKNDKDSAYCIEKYDKDTSIFREQLEKVFKDALRKLQPATAVAA